MDYYGDIVLMNSSEIINIVRRTLSKIDPRLVEHGERVGYIAKKIYDVSENKAGFDFSKLFILCVLHDIGAYKTNEIDDMVRFETEGTLEHAIYGYLFLRNTNHLSDHAEVLLYHHTDYTAMEDNGSLCSRYAQIIYLADRTDILLGSKTADLSVLRTMAGRQFDAANIDALLKAEKKYSFSEKIASGQYRDEVGEILESVDIRAGEILEYLKLLVYAIDFRSPYTVTHTADTTIISLETGRLLGLSDQELQTMYLGAFLHDIGKIAIPHDILEKPGKLTTEEYEIVKEHIAEGEAILRGVVSDEICDIALRHHEKMDGSGYPLGLTGDKLTVSQRIVAVADILSALSQRRVYKEPFPKEKVIFILEEMKDAGQLCPKVVDTICCNYDMIMRNLESSHDPVKTMYKKHMQEYYSLRKSTSTQLETL
ncbi:MAG: HD domain-containing protein [Clostridiales bacterium]|nr:HD domain-containing protein [Clostridiales bacterium]